jgi:carboxypeptidase family protein
VAIFIWILSVSSSATTCIALEKFKVRQVCGQVQAPLGDVIANATLRVITKGRPDNAVRTQTDNVGDFGFSHIDEGEYEIQVEADGFRPVGQEFEMRRPKRWAGMQSSSSCSHGGWGLQLCYEEKTLIN